MPRESTPGAGSDESVQGGRAGDQGGVSRVCGYVCVCACVFMSVYTHAVVCDCVCVWGGGREVGVVDTLKE